MPTKKKSKKKLFAIIGLAMIGVVGVVGYQMSMGGEEGEIFKPSVSDELGYVGLDTFLAPVVEGRRISKYIAVGIILELYSVDHKPLVYDNMTPLRNAFIDDFVFQAQMNSGTAETLHLRRVKTRFRTLATRILGPDIVKEVLISHVLDRGF
jgi:flagellar basal body-associated protein FliL